MLGTELPDSLAELFKVGETQWTYVDYEEEMDNVQSMNWFMDYVGIKDEDCIVNDDTQIIVKHPRYEYYLQIDAGCLGDFFSHGFEVTYISPEEL